MIFGAGGLTFYFENLRTDFGHYNMSQSRAQFRYLDKGVYLKIFKKKSVIHPKGEGVCIKILPLDK